MGDLGDFIKRISWAAFLLLYIIIVAFLAIYGLFNLIMMLI